MNTTELYASARIANATQAILHLKQHDKRQWSCRPSFYS